MKEQIEASEARVMAAMEGRTRSTNTQIDDIRGDVTKEQKLNLQQGQGMLDLNTTSKRLDLGQGDLFDKVKEIAQIAQSTKDLPQEVEKLGRQLDAVIRCQTSLGELIAGTQGS